MLYICHERERKVVFECERKNTEGSWISKILTLQCLHSLIDVSLETVSLFTEKLVVFSSALVDDKCTITTR